MASRIPKWLNTFTRHALTALQAPEPDDLNQFTLMLMRASTINPTVRGLIADGLRDALGGTYWVRDCAANVQRAMSRLASQSKAPGTAVGLAKVKRDPSRTLPADPIADWDGFWNTITSYAGVTDDGALNALARLLESVAKSGMRIGWETELHGYLSDPDLALIAEEAITHVADATPLLVVSLRHDVMPLLWRQPVELSDAAVWTRRYEVPRER